MPESNTKTVSHAAEKLPENLREYFIQTFEECNVMDLYDGEVEIYFQVILQTLRDRSAQLQKAYTAFESVGATLKAVSETVSKAKGGR